MSSTVGLQHGVDASTDGGTDHVAVALQLLRVTDGVEQVGQQAQGCGSTALVDAPAVFVEAGAVTFQSVGQGVEICQWNALVVRVMSNGRLAVTQWGLSTGMVLGHVGPSHVVPGGEYARATVMGHTATDRLICTAHRFRPFTITSIRLPGKGIAQRQNSGPSTP
jgi:hypothetical protein